MSTTCILIRCKTRSVKRQAHKLIMAACVGNNFAVYVRDSLQTRRGAPSACAAAPVAAQAPHGPRPLCRQVRTRCSHSSHIYYCVRFVCYVLVCVLLCWHALARTAQYTYATPLRRPSVCVAPRRARLKPPSLQQEGTINGTMSWGH